MGRGEIILFLLEQGADIHHKDHKKKTLLHYVCGNNMSLHMVQCLIDNGADIDVKDEHGTTPILNCALSAFQKIENEVQEREEIILFLMEQGAEIHHTDEYGNDVLYYCKEYGLKNAENMILMKMPNMINDKNVPFCLSSYLRSGYLSQAEKLVDSGVEARVDKRGNNALHLLCQSGKLGGIDLMKKILKQNTDYLNAK